MALYPLNYCFIYLFSEFLRYIKFRFQQWKWSQNQEADFISVAILLRFFCLWNSHSSLPRDKSLNGSLKTRGLASAVSNREKWLHWKRVRTLTKDKIDNVTIMAVLTFSFHSRDETPRSSRRASSLSRLSFFFFLSPPFPRSSSTLSVSKWSETRGSWIPAGSRSITCWRGGALRGQAAWTRCLAGCWWSAVWIWAGERQRDSEEQEEEAALERERLISGGLSPGMEVALRWWMPGEQEERKSEREKKGIWNRVGPCEGAGLRVTFYLHMAAEQLECHGGNRCKRSSRGLTYEREKTKDGRIGKFVQNQILNWLRSRCWKLLIWQILVINVSPIMTVSVHVCVRVWVCDCHIVK